MSFLSGAQPKVIPEFTGLQVNTAVQVLPVPIIYGCPRVSIDLVYYNGFRSVLVKQKSGGKGIASGGKGGGQQVEYFATIILAIGEGPLGDPLIIYQDQEVWTPDTFPSNGGSYFNGDPTQAPWDVVQSTWPYDARSYKNTAYYAFDQAQLDASATVPQINLVVQGFLTGSSPLNNSSITITSGQYDPQGRPLSFLGTIQLGTCDADPAAVIYDFLTNPTYGATFPAEFIDTDSLFTSPKGYLPAVGDAALSTYCQAVGLAWSVVVNNVESASSILDRWCKNLNVAPVWNGALLKFIPFWDQDASANPGWYSGNGIPLKYFSPNSTPVVTITLDQILQSDAKDEDPISFSRKDPMEVYNTVRVDFKDRTNFFNNVPAEAKDEVHIELYGPRVDNIGAADEFSLATYANQSATMLLRRNISVLNNYTWKMGPLWGWLEPMLIIRIPDPTNYNNTLVVRTISVDEDEEENVTITAEIFPQGAQSPSTMPMSPTTPPNQGPTNSPPASVYPPVIFAPTSAMLAATGFSNPQAIFGVSAGYGGLLDTNYGGCYVWVSLDGVNYEQLGSLQGVSDVGSLSLPLNNYVGGNPDNVDTIYVNLTECDGSLVSVDPTLAANGYSLCCLQDVSGFELISYTNATLVAPYTYALTGLYRGLYGTTVRAFGTGSRFLYCGSNGNFLEQALPPAYVGHLIYVKAQAFNVFNNATQDLADVVAYTYFATSPTPSPPLPPPSVIATDRRIVRGIKATRVPRAKRKGL